MTIVVIFDTVNIYIFLIFRSINIIKHGGIPPNCNGTANLYLHFGYNCSLQRYKSTFYELFRNWFLQSVAEWNYGNEVGQNKLEE